MEREIPNNQQVKPWILVVDDSPDIRMALKIFLNRKGWEVREAEHGRQALEMIRENKPGLMILDNRMPEMTGEEVCLELRSQGVSLPIILVTAAHEIEKLAQKVGLACYIGKPFQFGELNRLVTQAMTTKTCLGCP